MTVGGNMSVPSISVGTYQFHQYISGTVPVPPILMVETYAEK
jgi:hypothetical protein